MTGLRIGVYRIGGRRLRIQAARVGEERCHGINCYAESILATRPPRCFRWRDGSQSRALTGLYVRLYIPNKAAPVRFQSL